MHVPDFVIHKAESAIIGLLAIAAATGMPTTLFGLEEHWADLIAGLFGSGTFTYIRFRRDEQDHPITEWIASVLIGIGAGVIIGPELVNWLGAHEARTIVIAFIAGGFELLLSAFIDMDHKSMLQTLFQNAANRLGKK